MPPPIEPTATPQPTPTATPIAPNSAAGFRRFIDEALDARIGERPFVVNRYLAQLATTPLVDGETAVFLWRGSANQVQLIGDMTGWEAQPPLELEHVRGTELWYLEQRYESDARLDYLLLVDGVNTLDPRNPHTVASGFGVRSELRMPAYRAPAVLTDAADYPAGTLHEHRIDSAILGQRRVFYVYEPASQLIGAQRPSLYVQDGSEALTLINMPTLLDKLIARREAPPLVAVFVPPVDRLTEYSLSDDYADFLAQELLPFVQERYDTSAAPADTALLGASMGGLISLHTALRHPDKFGLVAAQSTAVPMAPDIVTQLARAGSRMPRIHLSVGLYEDRLGIRGETFDFLSGNRRLRDVLAAGGAEYIYVEQPQGHSWGFWEAQIGPALDYLYN